MSTSRTVSLIYDDVSDPLYTSLLNNDILQVGSGTVGKINPVLYTSDVASALTTVGIDVTQRPCFVVTTTTNGVASYLVLRTKSNPPTSSEMTNLVRNVFENYIFDRIENVTTTPVATS